MAEEEEGAVVVEAAEAPVVEEPNYDDRARRMGWRPKDEYHGDVSRWVDSKTFVERGERELPILRERFRKMDDRLGNTETKLSEAEKRLKESTEVLIELREMSRSAEDRGYRRAHAELSERERRAVAEANVEQYDAIQREKRQLEESRPKPPVAQVKPAESVPAAPAASTNPVIDRWVADNGWFNADASMHHYALKMDADIQRASPDLALEDKLAEVKRRVMTKFPENFDNPRRAAPAPVVASSAPPPKDKKRTIKDLPREAQEAYARFKKSIPNYTEEEYMGVYGASE